MSGENKKDFENMNFKIPVGPRGYELMICDPYQKVGSVSLSLSTETACWLASMFSYSVRFRNFIEKVAGSNHPIHTEAASLLKKAETLFDTVEQKEKFFRKVRDHVGGGNEMPINEQVVCMVRTHLAQEIHKVQSYLDLSAYRVCRIQKLEYFTSEFEPGDYTLAVRSELSGRVLTLWSFRANHMASVAEKDVYWLEPCPYTLEHAKADAQREANVCRTPFYVYVLGNTFFCTASKRPEEPVATCKPIYWSS